MKTRHTAIVSTQSETRINFGANSVLFRNEEGILSRLEAGCLPVYIQLAPGLSGQSFNTHADSFASLARGEAACPHFGLVCAPIEPKSGPLTQAKFFNEKTPKNLKNDKILLISLDLRYYPCNNFKFYSLQGQIFEFFLFFTYNQGKIFLILPITWGHKWYTWSPLGVAPRSRVTILKTSNTSLFTANLPRTWKHFFPLLKKVFPLRVTITVNLLLLRFFLFTLYLIKLILKNDKLTFKLWIKDLTKLELPPFCLFTFWFRRQPLDS